MSKTKHELFYIEWVDSQGVLSGWTDLKEFTASIPIMKSIGWIVYENKKIISVCANIGEETESTLLQGNGIMTIPKQCILSKKKIKV